MVMPSPLASASPTVKTIAPAVAGMPSRKEKRAESGRVKPRNRAAVMVTPERLVPGISAKRLRHADEKRAPSVMLAMVRFCGPTMSAISIRMP